MIITDIEHLYERINTWEESYLELKSVEVDVTYIKDDLEINATTTIPAAIYIEIDLLYPFIENLFYN